MLARVKNGKAVEIEVNPSGVYHAVPQLRSAHQRCKYMAVPRELRSLAINVTKGTGIGVMDGNGNILKRCRQK